MIEMPRCNECPCDEPFWEVVDRTFLDRDQEEILIFLECPECGAQLERKYRKVERMLLGLGNGKKVYVDAK